MGIGDWGLGIGDWGLGDEPKEFTVDGSNPKIDVDFERSYLIKVVEK